MPLSIAAIGMISSLGNASQGSAAARAGLNRPQALALSIPSDDDIEAESLTGHPCHGAEGFQSYGRLSYLAYLAISDLIEHYPDTTLNNTGIVLVMPSVEERPSLDSQCYHEERNGRQLLSTALNNLLNMSAIDFSGSRFYFIEEGEAGAGHALQAIEQLMLQGKEVSCLLLSVDSLLDETTLEEFLIAGRLKSPDTLHGFVPGEGASAVLLELEERSTMPSLATIRSVATGREEYLFPLPFDLCSIEEDSSEAEDSWDTDDSDDMDSPPPATLGQAYVEAIETVFTALSEGQTAEQQWFGFNDHNGDGFRTSEWGLVISRFSDQHHYLRELPWDSPASSFGNTGCAGIGIVICMAVRGGIRGYYRQHYGLICSSSDRGLRTAIGLHVT